VIPRRRRDVVRRLLEVDDQGIELAVIVWIQERRDAGRIEYFEMDVAGRDIRAD